MGKSARSLRASSLGFALTTTRPSYPRPGNPPLRRGFKWARADSGLRPPLHARGKPPLFGTVRSRACSPLPSGQKSARARFSSSEAPWQVHVRDEALVGEHEACDGQPRAAEDRDDTPEARHRQLEEAARA